MKVVVLSNHPLALLQAEESGREAQAAADLTHYEHERERHDERVDGLRSERDRARAERRWLAWMGGGLAVHRARRQAPPVPVPPTPDWNLRGSVESGMVGEQRVQHDLARRLDDEWTLICGYRGRGGEIDQLLLGPHALLAIEVKHRNATVFCDGDDWWYDKYDRYGNRVGNGTLADRRGRSPSQQLNEATDALESFLRWRDCPTWFARVVVFTHERAVLGDLRDPRVWICTSIGDVLTQVMSREPVCSLEARDEIERLVRRDHEFHTRRRHGGGAHSTRGTRSQ